MDEDVRRSRGNRREDPRRHTLSGDHHLSLNYQNNAISRSVDLEVSLIRCLQQNILKCLCTTVKCYAFLSHSAVQFIFNERNLRRFEQANCFTQEQCTSAYAELVLNYFKNDNILLLKKNRQFVILLNKTYYTYYQTRIRLFCCKECMSYLFKD